MAKIDYDEVIRQTKEKAKEKANLERKRAEEKIKKLIEKKKQANRAKIEKVGELMMSYWENDFNLNSRNIVTMKNNIIFKSDS